MAIEVAADAMVTISIPQTSFHELETLASELNLLTQDLIELALDAYLEQRDSLRAEHDRIKAAYADYPDETERLWQDVVRDYQRRRLMADEDNAW